MKETFPFSRGLGSSVTVRLGILMALANSIKETTPIPRENLLKLLIELEGHPDNAVPSFLGGFAVCSLASADHMDGFAYTRLAVKPDPFLRHAGARLQALHRNSARASLPKEISFRQAVENVQRTARIATAFATGEYECCAACSSIILHQPYRQVMIPGFDSTPWRRHRKRARWEAFSAAPVPVSWP